ncbi:MAG: helix-turn-helix transcriptional regulator [Clostridia bacterium]|nr:helix-turn-helix transcriptional regulator [Clostridia bacterium]
MYKLSERLKELRRQNNISQNALAKQMNLTRATVNAWEMGISCPNAQSLVMLSQYFKVSVDFLLGLNNRETIDITQLNEKEKNIVYDLVNYFIDTTNELT